jgi:hypothetical protein
MKKFILAVAMTLVLTFETVALMTIHPQPALACPTNGC